MGQGGTSSAVISPSWALGTCDRCGFTYPLNSLKREVFDEKFNGLRVCSTCLDVDNPQLQLGRLTAGMFDPQSLLDPRPDTGRPGSTSYFGWMPIGGGTTLFINCYVGNLTVVIT